MGSHVDENRNRLDNWIKCLLQECKNMKAIYTGFDINLTQLFTDQLRDLKGCFFLVVDESVVHYK